MTTIQDVIGDYTPLSNKIVKELKLIRGALACKIFYTSNLNDRVCRMGLRRIADDLGIDFTTASKNIDWLVSNEYLERVKEHTPTEPAHYRCTQKFYDLAKGVDLINTGVDVVNTGVDLINKEEEIKEERKERVGKKPHTIPALKIFVEVTGKSFLNSTQVKILQEKIGGSPAALEKWREVVTAWQLCGYKLTNIKGMLEWFDNGIPQYKNGNSKSESKREPQKANDAIGGWYA